MKKKQNLVGKKMIGFEFKTIDGVIMFSKEMTKHIGDVGEVIRYNLLGNNVKVKFENGEVWSYPLNLAKKKMLENIEKYKKYIGQEVIGFNFNEYEDGVYFCERMNDYLMEVGTIIAYNHNNHSFWVEFEDQQLWSYPVKKTKKNLFIPKRKIICKKATPPKQTKGRECIESPLVILSMKEVADMFAIPVEALAIKN